MIELVPIFAENSPTNTRVLTVRFDGEESEFLKLKKFMSNEKALKRFFQNRLKHTKFKPYKNLKPSYATRKTNIEFDRLLEKISTVVADPDATGKELVEIFKPLHKKRSRQNQKLEHRKAKTGKKSWVRVYALKVSDKCIIITGGGIKLVKAIQDDPDLHKELKNLKKVRRHLISKGVFTQGEIETLYYK